MLVEVFVLVIEIEDLFHIQLEFLLHLLPGSDMNILIFIILTFILRILVKMPDGVPESVDFLKELVFLRLPQVFLVYWVLLLLLVLYEQVLAHIWLPPPIPTVLHSRHHRVFFQGLLLFFVYLEI